MIAYKYTPDTHEYLTTVHCQLDPLESKAQGKDIYLLPADCTFEKPLEPEQGKAVVWNGAAWGYVADHRKKRDQGGIIIEESGTPYWMPEDTWESPARYMTELGELPDGALLVKPEKPQEVIEKELEKKYTAYIQHILDTEAQKLGYDHCNSVCTYVDTGVQKFDDEGVAFRKWRSAVWAKGYELLAEVQAGTRPIPTEEELIELLPKLEIVYRDVEIETNPDSV